MGAKRYRDAAPKFLLRDYLRLQAELDYWHYRTRYHGSETVNALLDPGKQVWSYRKCHNTITARARRAMSEIGLLALSHAELIASVGKFPVSRFRRTLVAMVAIVSDDDISKIMSDPLCYCSKSEMVDLIWARFAAGGWHFVEAGESEDESPTAEPVGAG